MVTVRRGGKAYQDQNAIKKDHHERRKTRPYILNGLKMGMDWALLLTGLIFGARQRSAISKPMRKLSTTNGRQHEDDENFRKFDQHVANYTKRALHADDEKSFRHEGKRDMEG